MDYNLFAEKAEVVKMQLYRTACLYMESRQEALDAVDEAIYKGFVNCRKLRKPEYFTTWLTRILINTCNTELVRKKREKRLPEVPEEVHLDFDSLPLKEAIYKLPDPLKLVIVLRFFGDYTLEEVAEILDLPRGTVSSRQKKALSLLRLDLGED